MDRRSFFLMCAALGLAPARFAAASALPKDLRIGYQKTAVLLVVKARKQLEQLFEPRGLSVRWVEFPFGPPLLEAVSAGHAGLPRARRRSQRLRPRGRRRLVDLGSVLRHRGTKTKRAAVADRPEGGGPEQPLSRQPRLSREAA